MQHNPASLHLSKKSIVKKTFQVGALTFLSRMLGILREALQIQFFGIGILSDAFIVAFRIPNLFRQVFAEGAMNGSFVPVMVQLVKKGKKEVASGLVSLGFIFFQSIILLLYLFVYFKTEWVVMLLAAGFSADRAAHTVEFLRILFPFLFLVSASALFAGALTSVNHFFIPALGPAIWNFVYVLIITLGIWFKLTPVFICWGVLVAGAVQLILHVITYFMCHFTFGRITEEVIESFKLVLRKFIPCFLGVSIIEINLLVSGIVASFLPEGSVSLLFYGARFLQLPIGIFAVAFSSILLPHFSRLVLYAPRRMSFYLLEVTKFVCWVIIPITLFFALVSKNLFVTLFSFKSGALAHADQAAWILIVYITGLLFICLSRVLMNIFYSFKDTVSATIISVVGALVNLVGDIIGMQIWGAYGIAGAASLASLVMVILSYVFLRKKHNLRFYPGNFIKFLARYLAQISVFIFIGFVLYSMLNFLFAGLMRAALANLLGFWFITCLAFGLLFLALLITKKRFGIRVYFIKR
ncbi:MAG: murein biosynthesis integral membrane protein MurJ [bacterium]